MIIRSASTTQPLPPPPLPPPPWIEGQGGGRWDSPGENNGLVRVREGGLAGRSSPTLISLELGEINAIRRSFVAVCEAWRKGGREFDPGKGEREESVKAENKMKRKVKISLQLKRKNK